MYTGLYELYLLTMTEIEYFFQFYQLGIFLLFFQFILF